ncbi:MAG: murein L,D-transpeptidase catalytic domain family protein, partial [Tatlockia sp.]|nr:murein L,D-transpeptidase catalytic domain family protein [Tatlockia sp.]
MINLTTLFSMVIANFSPVALNTTVQPINHPSEQVEIQRLSQSAPKLNKQALKYALRAYTRANSQGEVKNPVLTVIDFSLPSNQQRMWIFDMTNEKLAFKTYVAHGKNSGTGAVPDSFSNVKDSKQSSLGTYITKDTYIGHKGYSLHLEGLEKGLNSNAHDRHVVIHGAWYVEPTYIKKQGRAGSSWG